MSLWKSVTKAISNVVDPVLNIIGSGLNAATGVTAQQEQTYEQQKAAMEAQNAYNINMWNLANEYNSPASQLARMKEAGVDVNPTAYALGSSNLSNTAGTVGSASGFSGSGSPAGNPLSMAMGVASGIQGIRESKARQELTKENAINAMISGNNMLTQGTHVHLENDIMRHNLKIARETHTPVNSMPGLSQALVQAASSVLPSDTAKDVWKWLRTDSTKFPWRK